MAEKIVTMTVELTAREALAIGVGSNKTSPVCTLEQRR